MGAMFQLRIVQKYFRAARVGVMFQFRVATMGVMF